MFTPVQPGDEVPIYRQIVNQVREGVAASSFPPGHKLPSHRDLAALLAVAPLTVKKAYDELEAQGLIETRRGLGSFIRETPAAPAPDEVRERLARAARRLLTEARLAGVPLDRVEQLLRELDASDPS